jgi:hypothetical protein
VIDERIEHALRAPDPVLQLRDVAGAMLRAGRPRDDVLADFETARSLLRQAGREADEDAVMDVMDFITGWCSPHVKL